jgi:hypothetical protein
LQGTQSQHTKASLAKELQSPTHGKLSAIRHFFEKFFWFLKLNRNIAIRK